MLWPLGYDLKLQMFQSTQGDLKGNGQQPGMSLHTATWNHSLYFESSSIAVGFFYF